LVKTPAGPTATEEEATEPRRKFLKKFAYIAPAIVTYTLHLDARARGSSRGSPPDPPLRVDREGKEIIPE
jgi:hypothetical protein